MFEKVDKIVGISILIVFLLGGIFEVIFILFEIASGIIRDIKDCRQFKIAPEDQGKNSQGSEWKSNEKVL